MKSMRCFSFCPFWKVSAATRPDSSQAPRHHLHSFLGPGLLVQKNSQNQLLPGGSNPQIHKHTTISVRGHSGFTSVYRLEAERSASTHREAFAGASEAEPTTLESEATLQQSK